MSGLISKKHSGRRKKNQLQVSDSVRGADSSALTTVRVNNQIAFCKVSSLKKKEEVERLLLKNRISYYVRFKELGFFARLFKTDAKSRNVFTIYIHDTAIPLAKELVKGIKDVRIIC